MNAGVETYSKTATPLVDLAAAVPGQQRAPRLNASNFALWANLLLVFFATCLGLAKTGNPSRYFGEGRFTTGFSCLELLLTACFSIGIFRSRRSPGAARPFRGSNGLWLLVAAGFIFLAIDDAFQVHERMDGVIHGLLQLEHSALTDRIDDAIIGVYGFIGLGVLWLYRQELLLFRCMVRPLLIGFGFAFCAVACDALSNQPDVFLWMTGELARAKKLDGWFSMGDGGFTLLAEGMFAAAFFCGWKGGRLAQSA